MKQTTIATLLAFLLASCDGPAEIIEPGEVYEHPEKDGICGVNHEKCTDADKTMKKFRQLKKTNFQQVCIKEENQQQVGISFQVPRMLNTHPGEKDTIRFNSAAFSFNSDGADFSFALLRNDTFIATMSVDRFGNPLASEHGPVDSDDEGTIETMLVMLADPAIYERVRDSINACENTSPILWGYTFNGLCISCRLHLIAFDLTVGLLASALAKAKKFGSEASTGLGLVTGKTVDEFFSCDRLCGIGQCSVNFDNCLATSGGRDSPFTKRCVDDLARCCEQAQGMCVECAAMRGEHAKAGEHCCCFS